MYWYVSNILTINHQLIVRLAGLALRLLQLAAGKPLRRLKHWEPKNSCCLKGNIHWFHSLDLAKTKLICVGVCVQCMYVYTYIYTYIYVVYKDVCNYIYCIYIYIMYTYLYTVHTYNLRIHIYSYLPPPVMPLLI